MKKKTFEEWFKEVDREVQSRVGLSVRDLEDCPYRDWYDNGKTVKGAATAALKNAGFGGF